MTKKLFATMLAVAFFANLCAAQSGSSQSVTNWGEPVNGVQLSISLNTNILAVGSSTTVQCMVKNLSTNDIGWWVAEPTQGFIVLLTNNVGNVYRLTPEPNTNSIDTIISYSFTTKVEAGGIWKYSVPISISKEIKPGNYQLEVKQYFYQLKAKQYFHIAGNRLKYELGSNPLEVQVK